MLTSKQILPLRRINLSLVVTRPNCAIIMIQKFLSTNIEFKNSFSINCALKTLVIFYFGSEIKRKFDVLIFVEL